MEPNAANFVPLSPVSFLARAAVVEPDRIASVYGERRLTWREVETRCRGLASALRRRGLRTGQTVSVLAPNLPELLELQFAIPMAGGVLNTINLRLDAETIAYILDHGESRLVFCDAELTPLLEEAFASLGRRLPVVLLEAEAIPVEAGAEGGSVSYEAFLEEGDSEETFGPPEDEWQAIALNYTSGTSGRPKGVVYHHRGAYLMALGTLVGWSLPRHPVYLSVVPFFHCNGWQHPWALALVGGTMVFTRRLQPELLFAAIAREGVTHFGAAPVVLSLLAASEHAPAAPFDPPIQVLTAGAPPAPAILERTAALGLEVMQVYGLTETYGHVSHCLWREEWDSLPPAEQAEKQALQGVAFPVTEEFAVLDRSTGRPVPPDGATQGEIAIRGNTVMKGYPRIPRLPRRPLRAVISGPVMPRSSIRTATCKSATVSRMSSSPGARIFPRWKSRVSCTSTPPSRPRPLWPCPVKSGGRVLVPSSNCAPARTPTRRRSSPSASSASLVSRCPRRLSLPNFPRPRPARSRNSDCGSAPGSLPPIPPDPSLFPPARRAAYTPSNPPP